MNLLIGTFSTLLLENLARGNKTLVFNTKIKPVNDLNFNIFFPNNIDRDGDFWTDSIDNNKVNEYLEKYEKILFDIEKSGFKNAALVHSNSETATKGGIVGWVPEDNLNKNIRKVISKLQTGQISKPIRTSSGFIIIMIEDKRVSELKFNLAEKIDEAIRFKRNDQLNQFSNIYFNKIKKNLKIEKI